MDDRIWIETIARVIADCRNRNINTPDLIASAIGKELSNYAGISGEFERVYNSYGRFSFLSRFSSTVYGQ